MAFPFALAAAVARHHIARADAPRRYVAPVSARPYPPVSAEIQEIYDRLDRERSERRDSSHRSGNRVLLLLMVVLIAMTAALVRTIAIHPLS